MSCYIDPNATLSWDSLFPYVLPHVRGAPEELVAHYIRLATIEFCKFTGILHDVNQYNLQAHVPDYQLTTDCNYNIVRVFRVTVDKRWDYAPANRKLTCGAGAFLYYMSSPTMIHLRRTQNIDDPKGLEVETIVSPKQDSCVLENYLYEQWATELGYGALAKLLALGQTNWYDPKQAADFAMQFRKAKSRCRAEIDRAFTTTSMMKTEQWTGPANRGWGGGWNSGFGPNGWGQ